MVKISYLLVIISVFFISCKKEKGFDFVHNQELYEKSVQEILTDTMKSGTFFYFNAPKSYVNKHTLKFKNTLEIISKMKIDMIEKKENGVVEYYFLESGIVTNKIILYFNKTSREYKSDYDAKLIKQYDDNWSEIHEKKFNF